MNLGTRSVTLLRDYPPLLRAGDTVEAECWLNLDAYADCAEVRVEGQRIGLGRMQYGGWKYADDDAAQAREEYDPVEDAGPDGGWRDV